jgi:hypothetical protein
MVVLRGRLAPEVGAVLVQALAAASEAVYRTRGVSAETPTMAQQQADALALLAETALHGGIDPGAPGERYRWSSTSMPRCWRIRTRPASPSKR